MYEGPNSSRAVAKITYNVVAGNSKKEFKESFENFLKKKNNFSNINLDGIFMFARVARNIDGDFEGDYFSKLLACEYNPWKIDIMQNLHFVWFRERRMLHKFKKNVVYCHKIYNKYIINKIRRLKICNYLVYNFFFLDINL